jgi:hypothetical protein
MDNVQNCDSYINIPSSQTYRSYLVKLCSIAELLVMPNTKFTYHNWNILDMIGFIA